MIVGVVGFAGSVKVLYGQSTAVAYGPVGPVDTEAGMHVVLSVLKVVSLQSRIPSPFFV